MTSTTNFNSADHPRGEGQRFVPATKSSPDVELDGGPHVTTGTPTDLAEARAQLDAKREALALTETSYEKDVVRLLTTWVKDRWPSADMVVFDVNSDNPYAPPSITGVWEGENELWAMYSDRENSRALAAFANEPVNPFNGGGAVEMIYESVGYEYWAIRI